MTIWTPEKRAAHAEKIRLSWQDPAIRKRRSDAIRGKKRTEEQKAIYSQIKRAHWEDPVIREHYVTAASNRTYKDKQAFAEKMREQITALWRDPNYRAKVLKMFQPSKLELSLVPRIEALGYWHSGAGDFFVQGEDRVRNPDFKKHSTKKVVEIFGEYWHRNDKGHEQEILDWYRDAGYECVIVWESQVDRIEALV